MRQKIAIVAGGDSSEYEISIQSAAELLKVLDTKKYEAYIVHIRGNNWKVQTNQNQIDIDKNNFSFTHEGQQINFDCVLIAIHGIPGEDGKLQSYFDLIGIPYTSCGAFCSALSFNKFACKTFLKEFGIPVAKSIMVRKDEQIDLKEIKKKIKQPYFVKPNNSGSSFGISKVTHEDSLQAAILKAFTEDDEVIIEEFVNGTEVSCGLIKASGESHIFPLTEIISKNEFFDFEAKYTDGQAEEITPAGISNNLAQQSMKLSSKIYDKLGCHGIVRIDYIISRNTPYFLEINTVPGMSQNSIIPQQVRAYGRDLYDILDLSIQDAILRFSNSKFQISNSK